MATGRIVPFHTLDRQWDARFNIPTETDLTELVQAIQAEDRIGKFRYILISGPEIGDRPYQDDFRIRHIHVAAIFANRVSKASILKNWNVKQGLGYYLVPRNRLLPFSGWKKHHTKTLTKVDQNCLQLYENGILPDDKIVPESQIAKRSDEEKKRKLDDIIVEIKSLIESGNDKEAFVKFPRNYLTYGEKIKSMIHQKRDFFKTNGDMHVWLYGGPGSGKSALLQIIYPNYYNKNLDNRFFDLLDPNFHTHILLQDLDHNTIEKLGVQFLKTICDEAGFPIDQKYKTPQLVRSTILVSSNFRISDVLPEDLKGRNENLKALHRRFWEINIRILLQALGLKLLSKYEIAQLKSEGNSDPKRLFISYDYLRDVPTGDAIQPAEFYQTKMRELYYGNAVSV